MKKWFFCALAGFAAAQSAPESAAEGRRFVDQLKLEPSADQALFQSTGLDRANQLMELVVQGGLAPEASITDWENLHKALTGQAELAMFRGDFGAAITRLTYQEAYYNALDGDFAKALKINPQIRELEAKYQPTLLPFGIASQGDDLRRLGRAAEALEAYRQAKAMAGDLAKNQWFEALQLKIVQLEIELKQLDAARQELQHIKEGPSALLAAAHLMIADGNYFLALEALRQVKDPALKQEVSNIASTIVLQTQSLETAKEFSLEPLITATMLARRRLAGDIDGVLRELTATLEKARAEGDKLGQIQALTALAATYSAFNSPENQITALEEALDLTRSLLPADGLPGSPGMAGLYFGVLDYLGTAYADAHQFGSATRMFSEMQEKLGLLTKARVRVYALRRYETELKMNQARLGHPEGLLSLPQTGAVLEQLARLNPASDYYEKAIAAFGEQGDHTHELLERLEYARYLLKTGNPKARAQLEAAARMGVDEFQARWRIEYEFGLLAENNGDRTAAIARYRTAVARLEEVRSGLSQQSARQSLVDHEVVQDLYERLAGLLPDKEAWQSIERAKARSFIEMMGSRHDDAPELKETNELAKQIVNVKARIESSQDRSGLGLELNGLEQRFALARQQASLGKTRAGQSIALGSITLEAAQKLLPPKTTLLEYAFLPDGITAFVITGATAKQLRWKVDRRELERKVKEDLLPMLAGSSTETEVNAALDAVSRLLIDPVANSLARENERLIVISTGYLNYLPFEALKLPDQRSMIDAFTISYLPSASALQFLDTRKPLPGRVFLGAIGNVSVDGAAALPGTLTEIGAIAKIEPGATQVTGPEFTHDAALQALTKYDVVHFATHGEVDSNAPLFSALLTSPGANKSSRLFLYEIQALKLEARLVVLSACNTGKGRVRGGDEVAGFTRTLLLAGADSVVASLWKVNDTSTAQLMEEFYRSLDAGQTAAGALRASALAVRKNFSHPKYWAAFVLTGI